MRTRATTPSWWKRPAVNRQRTHSLLKKFFSRPSNNRYSRRKLAFKQQELIDLGPFKVSPLGLGTWAWGNKFLWGYDESMDEELQEVFDLVVRSGINLFDTADSYGTGLLNGRSEQLLGKFICDYSGPKQARDNICIATKLAPYPWRVTSSQIVAACRGSLRRLQADRLAIGQLHWSTANYQPLQERALWDGLVRLYDEGLVQAVGVSNYGPKQLQRVAEYLNKRAVPLVTAQAQFSLVSGGPAQQDIKSACDDLGIKLISYSPLGLGMLTGKYGPEAGAGYPKGPRGILFAQILPGLQPLLSDMREIAARREKSVAQVAINWCLCKGTIPIPGAKSLIQAEEALNSLGWRMTTGEVAALDAAAEKAPRTMLQNVFQTK